MGGWFALPREWISSFGEIAKFSGRILGQVYSLRVLHFFGETLRQCGVLILGSTIVIWGLVFIVGLQCGIEGAYFNRSVGNPAYAGVFAAWCDLRELVPYAFGYMMAAKVGTGIVAELGAMRISEEIDALEVMGIPTITYLVSTRVVAGVVVVVPLWCMASLAGYMATRTLVIFAYGQAPGVYDHYFHTYLQPTDLIWSMLQVIGTAISIMLVHTYYGFNASGGPAGVGEAVGRAVRASLVVAVAVTLAVAMAAYGVSGDFNLSG